MQTFLYKLQTLLYTIPRLRTTLLNHAHCALLKRLFFHVTTQPYLKARASVRERIPHPFFSPSQHNWICTDSDSGEPCYVTEEAGGEPRLLRDVMGDELAKERPIVPPGLLQPGR